MLERKDDDEDAARWRISFEKEPPKPGDNFGGRTVCASEGCEYETRADPANAANLLFSVKKTGDACADPCGCVFFTGRKDRRWWDSDSDIIEHADGASLPRDTELTRGVACLCVEAAA